MGRIRDLMDQSDKTITDAFLMSSEAQKLIEDKPNIFRELKMGAIKQFIGMLDRRISIIKVTLPLAVAVTPLVKEDEVKQLYTLLEPMLLEMGCLMFLALLKCSEKDEATVIQELMDECEKFLNERLKTTPEELTLKRHQMEANRDNPTK